MDIVPDLLITKVPELPTKLEGLMYPFVPPSPTVRTLLPTIDMRPLKLLLPVSVIAEG
jgi:hypothetical protein